MRKQIEELDCPHFDDLTDDEIYEIMMLANEYAALEDEKEKKKFWKKHIKKPTIAQKEFMADLMYQLEQDPDMVFDVTTLEF